MCLLRKNSRPRYFLFHSAGRKPPSTTWLPSRPPPAYPRGPSVGRLPVCLCPLTHSSLLFPSYLLSILPERNFLESPLPTKKAKKGWALAFLHGLQPPLFRNPEVMHLPWVAKCKSNTTRSPVHCKAWPETLLDGKGMIWEAIDF